MTNCLEQKTVTIDVILPTYRPGDYVEHMISSIASNFRNLASCDVSTRLLIILNGPREPYYSHLVQLLSHYPILNAVISYTELAGVSHARNLGIEMSEQTDFILFVDDDDILSDKYLLDMISVWDGNKDTIVQSNTSVLTNNSSSGEDNYISRFVLKSLSESTDRYSPFYQRKLLNSVCGKLFCRELIGALRFDESVRISEDALFLFSLSSKIKRISLAPGAVYMIRKRYASASRKNKPVSALTGESFLFIRKVSQVYWTNPFEYSFPLYLSRVLASIKFLVMRINRQ